MDFSFCWRTCWHSRCLLAFYTPGHHNATITILTVGAGIQFASNVSYLLQLLMWINRNHKVQILTERIRSPLLSSPLRSAGPPASMKDTKMPSPSSPPTMLKPRPVEPLCSNTFRGSLPNKVTVSMWRAEHRGDGQNYHKTARKTIFYWSGLCLILKYII